MRIWALISLIALSAGSMAWGSTLDLNDGRSVQGQIIKQNSKSVDISVDGVTMTYFSDEVKDVDGKPLGGAPQTAATQDNMATAQPQPMPQDQTSANTSQNGIDPAKKALILQFIDVFGTRQALTNNFDLMLRQIEKEKPEEAQKIRERVKVDEIIDRLLPIYDRNFSSDDLKAFIAFYGSDEGQKLIHTIPELMKESVQESVKYMEEKFPEVKQNQ